jgi:hypothetical protein
MTKRAIWCTAVPLSLGPLPCAFKLSMSAIAACRCGITIAIFSAGERLTHLKNLVASAQVIPWRIPADREGNLWADLTRVYLVGDEFAMILRAAVKCGACAHL